MPAAYTLPFIVSLYNRYREDLDRVRTYQKDLYRRLGYWHATHRWWRAAQKTAAFAGLTLSDPLSIRPQLDDIEAEITYLVIRKNKPRTVVEISPSGGWSTTWILHALRDNKKGRLFSYDLIEDSTKTVPADLSEKRWTFVQGDVRKRMNRLPEICDYLFIDSDHSGKFASWYISRLFPKLRRGTAASIHDVYHDADPSAGEGELAVAWLAEKRIPYFTASRMHAPDTYDSLMQTKVRLHLADRIHHWQDNSMIWFQR